MQQLIKGYTDGRKVSSERVKGTVVYSHICNELMKDTMLLVKNVKGVYKIADYPLPHVCVGCLEVNIFFSNFTITILFLFH